ncbi:protein disulfide isomerase, putative [Entamoeba dispar SAW760]|uniref:Protein disulfide isomerase, putative n=1 Tax=Entamoeba dispar (strain ATCC PRA-260 / SAW760) TaxID=370354 RepID=B0EGP0_ENTDS|nr:protein disulfide isomerase, putative [Entamoeba dispar SAW760]EDR26314.1 protein disulfide isomerase, putative [Entamoeba dispar SAW760]|eukprot:EDR26314.1 protein disulfide isomerase, putative [Entamoeba dispar SAW760]
MIIAAFASFNVSPQQLEREQKKGGKFFVRYYAPWCGFCKMMSYDYKKLFRKYKGTKVTVCQIDCDKYNSYCEKMGIEGFPTLKLYDGASLISEYEKDRTYKDMDKFLSDYLA